jgi:DNA-binding beta-propeller fold protein YncE
LIYLFYQQFRVSGNSVVGFVNGVGTVARLNEPAGIAMASSGEYALVVERTGLRIRRLNLATYALTTIAGSGSSGSANGIGTYATFDHLSSIALAPNMEFAVLTDKNVNKMRKLNMSNYKVTTYTGSGTAGTVNGVGTNARHDGPEGVAISADSAFVVVADKNGCTLRVINVATRMVTTLAGKAGICNSVGKPILFNMFVTNV